MARLLAAKGVAVLAHAGIDVLVAHVGLLVRNARLVQRAEEAEVRHDRGNNGLLGQTAVLVHIAGAHVQDQVAVNHVAALVNGQAAVGVAVVGKAHIKAVLHHKALQLVDVGRAAIDVDVKAVRRVVDHVGLGTQGVKDRARDRRSRAVCAVQANLEPLQRKTAARDKARDVAVAALHVVNGAANVVLGGQRNLAAAVDVLLDELKDVLVHLKAVAVDQLDAVVGVGVVRGGDHHTAVKRAVDDLVGNAGRGNDVQHVGVAARSHQARDKGALEHVARAAGVLTNDDAGLLALASAVVPAHKTADLVGVLDV